MEKRYLLIISIMLFCSLLSRAYDFMSGMFGFDIISKEERTVEITYAVNPFNYVVIKDSVLYEKEKCYYTVTSIGDHSFANHSLRILHIPKSVKKIGKMAFMDCVYLSTILGGESIEQIGDFAFYGNRDLKGEMKIGESLKYIGESAFRGCTGITGISIPATVEHIGDYCFAYMKSLEKIEVDPQNPYYSSLDGILYDKGKTVVLSCPQSITDVEIPETVISIGNGAFFGWDGSYLNFRKM